MKWNTWNLLQARFRFLDRLVSSLEEKKHHEVKLKEGLKGLAAKRMELHNSLSSSWPKQVSFFSTFFQIKNTLIYNGQVGFP